MFVTNDTTCPLHIAAQIEQVVDLIPAADVKPIIYCKDCKYAYINRFTTQTGQTLCGYWTNKAEGVQMLMSQAAFCSFAEKRN